MSGRARYFVGVACVLGYIAIASSQSVALSVWLASEDVFLVVGLSFLIVTALFAAVGLRSGGPDAYRAVLGRRPLIVALNVAATFNWLFYFLAVKYLPPAVAVTLTQGIGPLSMTAYKLVRRQPISRVTRACVGTILVAAVSLCIHLVAGAPAEGAHDRADLLLGILVAVICSVSITATLLLSRTFAAAQIPASVVLSVRFPLLVLICASVVPTQDDVRVTWGVVAVVLTIALVGVATAAYTLQRGVELAPPLAVSTCLTLSPMVVLGLDTLRARTPVDPALLALIGIVVVAAVTSIVHDGRRTLGTSDAPAGSGAEQAAQPAPVALPAGRVSRRSRPPG